jgi:hypothetical protein
MQLTGGRLPLPTQYSQVNSVPDVASAPVQGLRLTPVAVVILLAGMHLSLRNWTDYDLFWHLSNGRLMVRDGISPSPDRFSWAGAGREVALHYARADRILYTLWDWNGPAALSLFSALLLLGALLPFALLIGRLGLKPVAEAGAILLLATAYLPFLGARPHLLGVWMLGVLAIVLEQPFAVKRAALAGIALGCWVNLHGSFPIGFAFAGLAAVIWAYRRDLRSAAFAVGSLLLGGVGAAVSPVGLEAFHFKLGGSSHPVMSSINADWTGLRPLMLACAPMTFLVIAGLAVGVWHRLDPRTVLSLLLVLATIQYTRFTIFAAPILLIEVLKRVQERTDRFTIQPTSSMASTLRRPLIARGAWGLLAAGVILTAATTPSTSLEQESLHPIPEAAVQQMLACGAPAPVWNDFNWGGYITWKSDGAYLTSIDGRSTPTLDNLFPAAEFNNNMWVTQGRLGWDKTIQDSPSQYVLLPVGAPPVGSLPGWRLVYQDDIATLSARDGAVWNCPVASQANH